MLPVALLAGGLATRLRPLTEQIPKALVPVAGRPFIAWQLDYLRGQGIARVVLCIGYLGEQIERVIGTGAAFGLDVQYVSDGPKLLGTGGALRRALPRLGEAFFVLYGDSFLPIDFAAVQAAYLRSGRRALMTVMHNRNQWDTSNVEFRDGVLVEYNKRRQRPEMQFIDYGLSVLAATVLASYPAGEAFDLADVYCKLSLDRELAGYEIHERFYEIGSPLGLRETEAYLGGEEGRRWATRSDI